MLMCTVVSMSCLRSPCLCNKRTTSHSSSADHTDVKFRPLRYQSRHTTEQFFFCCHPNACSMVRSLCQQLFPMSNASLFAEHSCIATAFMSHVQIISVRTLETHIYLLCLCLIISNCLFSEGSTKGNWNRKGTNQILWKKLPLKK